MVKDLIIKKISEITGIDESEIIVSIPTHDTFGDLSTNIAIIKHLDPNQITQKLSDDIKVSKYISKIEIAGPGFINFYYSKDYLLEVLENALKEKNNFGRLKLAKDQKIMVEFAHPNTHKAFHIGHLRNITTGESVCRILEFAGAKVIRANYQGDIGLHIAKAIWGVLHNEFKDPKDVKKRAQALGRVYALGSKAYEEDEKAKKEIIAINNKLYDKADPQINEIYQKTRTWSLDYFDTIYKRVYVNFDRLYFESEVADEGKKICLEALKNHILQKSQGAIVFKGEDEGLHTRVFITSQQTPTYEAKDLGLAKLQFEEFNPDKILHVVGPEQADYFKVVFKVIEKVFPDFQGRELHVPYGWVKLKEGKMSSRTGNVVLGEWLLDTVKEKIVEKYKVDEKIADQVSVAAVKYSFLKAGLEKEIAFDIEESINIEGNSGPYLQYTFARTKSVILKTISKKSLSNDSSFSEKINNEELALLKYFAQFQGAIVDASKNYSPNILCEYLYTLAQKYNNFYNTHKIINATNEDFRLKLTKVTNIILQSGINLLGIKTPERM